MDNLSLQYKPATPQFPIPAAPVTQPTAQTAPVAAPTPQAIPQQNANPQPTQGGLDPTALTLTKAIAYQENGGHAPDITNLKPGASGEMASIYQYTPDTWKAVAGKYLGDPNAPVTPENENQATYLRVKDWLSQGYTPAQIASMHNAGPGAPNAYLGNAGTNKEGVQYDTAAYVKGVQKYAEQLYNEQNGTPTPTQPTPEQPSLGGFAGNVVKSGANLLGNTAEALLHPIQTVQNIGGAAVGGLQELGGQQNAETQKFDNVINYFKQRYGGASNLEQTLYSDPVGVLADLSAALGGGAGIAGTAGKLGELGTAADASRAATLAGETGLRTMQGDIASGNALTRTTGAVQEGLQKASNLTNPITPVISGIGAVAGKAGSLAGYGTSLITGMDRNTIDTILRNPESFTPEEIANASRTGIAKDIETALAEKDAALSDVGASYKPLRETPVPIKTTPDYLDNTFRKEAKVDIVDGVIKPNAGSLVRNSADIAKLQSIYNLYKPDFLKGTMDSSKFLNLRADLAEKANFGNGLTKNVERAAAGIRDDLNKTYRDQISGLSIKDEAYALQKPELERLSKGFIDKEGNLLDSAVNKIANAGGVGKDNLLARLEEILPGITKRLEIQKAIEDIHKAGENKIGTYAKATVGPGGLAYGVATGNIPVMAGSIAAIILGNPSIAVPLIKLFGNNKELIAGVTAHLAKAANLPTVLNRAASQQTGQSDQSDTGTDQTKNGSPDNTQLQESVPQTQTGGASSPDTSTPGYAEAIAAGYTPGEIAQYFASR